MAVRVGDVMSLISDLIDFFRSVHEALTERGRKRAAKASEACARSSNPKSSATDSRP